MTTSTSRNHLHKLFKTQASSILNHQQHSKQFKSDHSYNLKDFLPSTSNIIQPRNKTKSTFIPQQNSFTINNTNKSSTLSVQNVQQKMIQQKMNKLKQQNIQFKQTIDQQKFIIKNQSQEINQLKKQIEKIKLFEQKKPQKLSLWSYKYHIQYTPKQKHKYSLAVQTDDIFTNKLISSGNTNGGLRAKDFQDIYKKLNSNPSMMIDMGTKKIKIQQLNTKLTLNNPSTMISNSTIKLNPKKIVQNKSLFQFQRQQQQNVNKQNMMRLSNMNFIKNPMQINMSKIQYEQKPIKEQSLQIYPVQQEYLDMIVGQLLCGDD